MPDLFSVDISEDALLNALKKDTFNILLRDHSRKAHAEIRLNRPIKDEECDQYHIIWATKDYEKLGPGYGEMEMIMPDAILGEKHIVVPRSVKDAATQRLRTQDKAEVFTPSWVCNAQNNLIDEAWFGRKDVFNTVSEDGHTWQATTAPVTFPEGKTWIDYISDVRLEITCGEAPYLVSRYDTTTGELIPIDQRIGLLDRKMRVIKENCNGDYKTWVDASRKALESCYGYEWQGDSLLLARENIIVSMMEYYQDCFHTENLPPKFNNGRDPLNSFAYIISWNIWQMDGLQQTLPYFSEPQKIETYKSLKKKNHDKNTGFAGGLFDMMEEEDGVAAIKAAENEIPFCRIRKWPKYGDSGKGQIEIFIESFK